MEHILFWNKNNKSWTLSDSVENLLNNKTHWTFSTLLSSPFFPFSLGFVLEMFFFGFCFFSVFRVTLQRPNVLPFFCCCCVSHLLAILWEAKNERKKCCFIDRLCKHQKTITEQLRFSLFLLLLFFVRSFCV